MQKIILPISKCIPGMVTAQPVVNMQTGATILGQNQELTIENLKNISNFIHTDLWVYIDSFNKVWNLPPETIENYKKYSKALKTVIEQISPSDDKSIKTFDEMCHHLSADFNENHTLLGCTNLIKQLDYDTYTHSLNVAFLSKLICKWTNVNKETTLNVIRAALLHDIGGINLAFDMINKTEDLSSDERSEYEKHSIYSYNIVSKMQDLHPSIAKGILAHHERCDGTGFPLKLTSPYINNLAKIIGIADRYEILRKTHHIFDTLKILLTDELTKFDPDMLLTFCNNIANYYIGVFVTLSTDEIGEVVFINPKCIYKPIIKINDKYINLYETPSITIINIE
ncbi:HD-GYP domain-containing protein [Cellulosilyticum sp. I15G10I2]|uniref:HD-GYP domain-containing protein n=1 Tax=Cellulosilyticum sp. I15G10I2 TaxID=1892843 RepID=UPI00085BC00F|nr:HD domain-containing phosphohydrolase [Cellulosilyticum sp. I15G10I2]